MQIMLILSSNLHGYNLTAIWHKIKDPDVWCFRGIFLLFIFCDKSLPVQSVTWLSRLKSASAQKQPTDSTQLSNALLNNIAVRTRDGNACSVLCTMQDFHYFDPISKDSIFVVCYTRLAFFFKLTPVLPFSSSFPTLGIFFLKGKQS